MSFHLPVFIRKEERTIFLASIHFTVLQEKVEFCLQEHLQYVESFYEKGKVIIHGKKIPFTGALLFVK